MPTRRRAVLALAVLAVCGVGGLLAGLAALDVLRPPTAIRSTYALAGAVIALVAYAATGDEAAAGDSPRSYLPASVASKFVVLCGLTALVATVHLGSRLVPVVAFLLVAYALVADQLAGDPDPGSTLLALTTVFVVPVAAKYLTTGFYFGGTDVFAHVDALHRLLATGRSAALPYGYDLFPVFHLFTGALTFVTGFAPYDAIVLTGVLTYAALVPVTYLVGVRLLGDRRTALCVAAAFTILDLPAYDALYFFPQSFALALLAVGFYAVLARRAAAHAARRRAHAVYAVVLVPTLVLAHHLTYVLLVGVLVAVAGVAFLRGVLAGRLGWDALATRPFGWARLRWTFPVVLGLCCTFAYLVYSPSLMLYAIVSIAAQVLGDTVRAASSVVLSYGAVLPADSVGRALAWLATPVGVYASLAVAFLLLGGYEFLERAESYARAASVLAAAFVLAVVLLPLPVTLPQGERLQFVVVLLAVLPFGLGLARLLRTRERSRAAFVAALVVVAAFGSAGAFTRASADDLDGPPVYVDQRGAQVAMSDSEYAAVGDAAAYLVETDGRAASDVVTRRALASVPGPRPRVEAVRVTPSGVTTPAERVVVRDAWTRHFVPTAESDVAVSAQLEWYTVSETCYRHALATRDVVFSGDGVRVVETRAGDALFGNGTAPTAGRPD
ncbi:hypothetical protein J2752_000343 [Halarchaeum rubridurum]|uniref:Dolichyl-phosphate-mannose-protein mannosyltransferase n=1 Tax=Halarchaeum rubridurum TaxID=489911 RepID=A0A830FUY8_9EURY|nr:hypothetical protein [Halarchaeum rubridurum]MBP1953462.1 hypothetical protein [Halarchaeum rubridurum]GGM65084.1 hypothetical protein GCM10009017_13960 [Halarchaeum rubridurum]